MPGCAMTQNAIEAAIIMMAVVIPPKSAMDTPATREPRNCKRLTIVAVKIPSGIAAPNCRNAQMRTAIGRAWKNAAIVSAGSHGPG
jgi:hypothetical protein